MSFAQGQIDSARVSRGAPVADATIRGLLIIAIVLGHSHLLTDDRQLLFVGLYFWHVQGFFALAYGRLDSLRGKSMRDRAVRYMVPFLWLTVPLGIGRLVAHVKGVTLGGVAAALVIGSAPLLETQIGLALFWFLPAFLGFTLAMAAIAAARHARPGLRWPIDLALVALGLINLALPREALQWLPLGAGMLGYLLALSVIHSHLYPLATGSRGRGAALLVWAVIAVVVVAEAVSIWTGQVVNTSIFTFARPYVYPAAVLHLLAGACMNVAVFALAHRWRDVALLNWIGERSLQIFLFHQFALIPLTMIGWRLIHHSMTPGPRDALGVVAALGALVFALIANAVLDRLPRLRRLIFPAGWSSLFVR